MAVELALKVVPGAARTRVAGMLGERLKIQVAAAPEKGRANVAVESFLAQLLNISTKDVTVIRGETSPFKTVALSNFVGYKEDALALLLGD